MNVLDLFSGIGGMALGFQQAGLRPVAFCENHPYARAILARAWPTIPCYKDIRLLTAKILQDDHVPRPEILCGGFPCQDLSTAGRAAGLDGTRSGLWHEMLRLVRECRPDWVVVENVPALRVRGADRVLAGLDAAGYASWPLVVGAAHAAAPHRRSRVFILAHATGAGLAQRLSHPTHPAPILPTVRHAGWATEPSLDRVAYGVPTRVDRLRALGNAVVPDVAAMIAQALLTAQAALADRTRSANVLRNLATFGPTTARQYPE
jgi:DNA (cytosine-5)-methyltransferase 1